LWGSDGYTHSAGERIAKAEASDGGDGELQRFTMPITSKSTATCLRLKILSGWGDYVSIHRFNVTGGAAEPRK